MCQLPYPASVAVKDTASVDDEQMDNAGVLGYIGSHIMWVHRTVSSTGNALQDSTF